MTVNDANRIIAEYMGEEIAGEKETCAICDYDYIPVRINNGSIWNIQPYHESLDSLQLVWKKLKDYVVTITIYQNNKLPLVELRTIDGLSICWCCDSLAEASAIVTAKAIEILMGLT